MKDDGLIIKGNKEGIKIIININKFKDFDHALQMLGDRLDKSNKFYKGASIVIETQLAQINEKGVAKIKSMLFDEFFIKECVFENTEEDTKKVFTGVYEGRTKFIRKTVRSGQVVEYSGNVVIIGDVNPGSEIYAGGNIMVFGSIRGNVHAGYTGNKKAVITSFRLQPALLQIANIMTRAPEGEKPDYPEIAKIKGSSIVVEPYSINKFI
ncbi:septum site-determining protein MinC [Clostridium sp. DL1XJH146]